MIKAPSSKYIKSIQAVLKEADNEQEDREVSELDKIREWATMEFGAHWMDIELTEEDCKIEG